MCDSKIERSLYTKDVLKLKFNCLILSRKLVCFFGKNISKLRLLASPQKSLHSTGISLKKMYVIY